MKLFKKFIIPLICLFIAWCSNSTIKDNEIIIPDIQEDNNSDIHDFIKQELSELFACDKNDNSKTFVNFVILWTWENKNWNTEYYLVVDSQWYIIDERWNLSDTCGMWIPVMLEIASTDNSSYSLISYKEAEDGNRYTSSVKEMFSKQAFDIWTDWKYSRIYNKKLLQQAEEYFWVTVLPKPANEFDCKFCDKIRYENNTETSDKTTNDLIFNFTTETNWNKTIYFWSDWTFETKWSRDEWTWTRQFWQNENTIILINDSIPHVYDRYIITDQTENSLSTILEIIQNR